MAADRNPVEKSFSALHDRAPACRQAGSTSASSPRTRRSLGEVGFDADLRLRCAASLRDHYTAEVVAFNFSAYEGRPLSLPTEAAGPKPEYLEWHRREVFGKR